MAAALPWQSLQSRVTPYVVEVDRLGEARAVAPANPDYTTNDPPIAWHLAELISKVRTVSLYPVLMLRDWLRAYVLLSTTADHSSANSAHPETLFRQAEEGIG